jgi:hypothetical protein
VYRGGAGAGSKEAEVGNVDRNAKFVRFEDFLGEPITETALANSGDEGIDIVVRITEFAERSCVTGSSRTSARLSKPWANGSRRVGRSWTSEAVRL